MGHRLQPASRPAALTALGATLGAIALTATLTPQTGAAGRFPRGPVPVPGALAVHVAFQLADCAATLSFLEVLDHPSLAGRVRLSTLVFIGAEADSERAARALGDAARAGRLAVASAATRRRLRGLGFRRTPFLIVEDAAGAIRLTAPVPRGPWELRSLHASLRALADLEARRGAETR